MFLVQVLVPLSDNAGDRFPETMFTQLREELTREFGGLTAYTRSPAVGLWSEDDASPPKRDDIVVYEIVAHELDRAWWASYRATLEERFDQDELMIHAHSIERL